MTPDRQLTEHFTEQTTEHYSHFRLEHIIAIEEGLGFREPGFDRCMMATMLAIYCSTWDEGGAERLKLDNQEDAAMLPPSTCLLLNATSTEKSSANEE